MKEKEIEGIVNELDGDGWGEFGMSHKNFSDQSVLWIPYELLSFDYNWSPCFKKDIVELERVQKRFTRMLPRLEGLSYRERLIRLGLFSSERWRLRVIEVYKTLIEVYKIMRGMDRMDSQGLFPR
eukprot:g48117.t1